MKPEQLKKLAEAIGYESFIAPNGYCFIWYINEDGIKANDFYNPATNPAQLLEVFLWTLNQQAPDGEQITMKQLTDEIMAQAMKEIGE